MIGVLSDDGSKILTRYEIAQRSAERLRARSQGRHAAGADQRTPIRRRSSRASRSSSSPTSATTASSSRRRSSRRRAGRRRRGRCRRCSGRIRASSPIRPTPARSPAPPIATPSISGASHLLFLTQGYAIIDDPTMPIVGPGETANDTYIQQLVASAQAAVDRAVQPRRHRSQSRRRRAATATAAS